MTQTCIEVTSEHDQKVLARIEGMDYEHAMYHLRDIETEEGRRAFANLCYRKYMDELTTEADHED